MTLKLIVCIAGALMTVGTFTGTVHSTGGPAENGVQIA